MEDFDNLKIIIGEFMSILGIICFAWGLIYLLRYQYFLVVSSKLSKREQLKRYLKVKYNSRPYLYGLYASIFNAISSLLLEVYFYFSVSIVFVIIILPLYLLYRRVDCLLSKDLEKMDQIINC